MEEPEEALAEDAECVVELDAASDSEEAEEAEGDSEEAEEEEEEEEKDAEAVTAAATAEAEVEFVSEEEEELLEDEETEERSWPVPVVIARRLGWSAVCAFPWWWQKGDGERTPFDSLAVEVGRVGRLGG